MLPVRQESTILVSIFGDRARHIWRFRLSEIAAAVSSTGKSCFASMQRASIVRPRSVPGATGTEG